MLAVQVCCARHCELPLSKMGNQGLFPGRVSEANQGRGQPRRGYRRPKPATHSGAGRKSRRAACFLWYFLSLRKKVLPPSGRQPHHPRRSRRVNPSSGKGGLRLRAPKRLSSGQTIGAVRTAVRSACCLPELRVANRLRRLYPLDTRFPSFPFGNLRAPKLARNP